MEFTKVNLVYFSATDVSKKYAQAMGKAISSEVVEYDMTLPCGRDASKAPKFKKDDLVILSLPIYGGRVPTICLEYLDAMSGEETPCIVIGTYGNRHYDDALVEMEDIMTSKGFVVTGAAAVIGRHSFSDEIAGHRPTQEDLEGAANFAKMIAEKEFKAVATGVIPGTRPYKDKSGPMPIAPSPSDDCTGCMECAKHCPNGVISMEDPKKLAKEPTACIRCNRCVVICPKNAMRFTQPPYLEMIDRCIAMFGKPDKENLYFM